MEIKVSIDRNTPWTFESLLQVFEFGPEAGVEPALPK